MKSDKTEKTTWDRLELAESVLISLTLALSFCLFLVAIAAKFASEGW